MQKVICNLTVVLKNVYFIVFGLIIITLILIPLKANEPIKSEIIKVDFARLVSKADLHYTSPVLRSEEGIPVGFSTFAIRETKIRK